MSATITIHTQSTNDDYNNNQIYKKHKCWLQSKSDGEKDEFSKHFWKWTVSLCILDQMVVHSISGIEPQSCTITICSWSLISKGMLPIGIGSYTGNFESTTICWWEQASEWNVHMDKFWHVLWTWASQCNITNRAYLVLEFLSYG